MHKVDHYPAQDNWSISSLMSFSTYSIAYNMMSYNQDYNEQPIYELDCNYSEDSDFDKNVALNVYRSYL